jgi:hypothetical protein
MVCVNLSTPKSRVLNSVYFREEYIAPIPDAERHDMLLAYHAQLNSVDDQTRMTAAKAWAKWEYVTTAVGSQDVSKPDLVCSLSQNGDVKVVRRSRASGKG